MAQKFVSEGSVKIALSKKVFYNPKMEFSRDVNIACAASFSGVKRYADALAATGISGIRVAKEVGHGVTLNDWNKDAFKLIQKNTSLNGVDCEVNNENANAFLSRTKFDAVDIDPFGSPAPYLSAASHSAMKYLMVTATDTAPLCGAHSSGKRRYAAIPLNTEYHAEMGIRILLGKIARELVVHDKGFTPLLSLSREHFVRTWLKVARGARRADESISHLGYIIHCFSCGYRSYVEGLTVFVNERCPLCESEVQLAGPLYLGRLHDKKFCEQVMKETDRRGLRTKNDVMKTLNLCNEELDIPYHYDHHRICKRLKTSPCEIDLLIDRLKDEGFLASRTHFSGTSFKTNASVRQIENTVRSMG
jgi:tRNA (guanine26-N2/guanine27-N2)-dimethyltransferase